VLPDVAFARSTQKMQTEALWAKLNAYQNATGISTEKKISIWERSQEFLQESDVKGKPILFYLIKNGEILKNDATMNLKNTHFH